MRMTASTKLARGVPAMQRRLRASRWSSTSAMYQQPIGPGQPHAAWERSAPGSDYEAHSSAVLPAIGDHTLSTGTIPRGSDHGHITIVLRNDDPTVCSR